MSLLLHQKKEWSLEIIYRPHYELAVQILDSVLDRNDAAKIRQFRDHLNDISTLTSVTLSQGSQWKSSLKDAYNQDPNRLHLHGLILTSTHLSDLLSTLHESSQLTGTLRDCFIDALTQETKAFYRTWGHEIAEESAVDIASIIRQFDQFEDHWLSIDSNQGISEITRSFMASMPMSILSPLLRDFQRCRRSLFQGAPPSLTLLHSPALYSSGRGAQFSADHRLIAVSFLSSSSWVFCQMLHEEVHVVTDLLFDPTQLTSRDSRQNQTGYMVHQTLELKAVDRTSELIRQSCPQRIPDDINWRTTYQIKSPTPQVTPVLHTHEFVTFSALDQSRQRLIRAYFMSIILIWLVNQLNTTVSLLFASGLFVWASLLCFDSLTPKVKRQTTLIKWRTRLGVYDLTLPQKLALVVSIALQVMALKIS